MILDLHPKFKEALQNKFTILDIINLAQFDQDFPQLLNQLKSLKDKKTNGFSNNEKIIFYHFDTEYYIYNNLPGVLIINLYKILTELDIPLCFTLLISNHKGLQEKLIQAKNSFAKNEKFSIPFLFCNFQLLLINPSKIKKIDLNTRLINKKFVCLNGIARYHRTALISSIKQNDLLSEGIISYNLPK
jgi:hypothetical protein